MLPDISASQENIMWIRVRETGPESQLSEISSAQCAPGFGSCPPSASTDFSVFCVFFHREHFWMPCPCFSWGIFCSHRFFVRMHSRGSQHHHRHNQALQEPLCCGSCPWIPHLSENISFLLLPVLLSLPAFLAICSTLQRLCEFSGPPVNLLLQFVPLFKPMWIPRWSRKP